MPGVLCAQVAISTVPVHTADLLKAQCPGPVSNAPKGSYILYTMCRTCSAMVCWCWIMQLG